MKDDVIKEIQEMQRLGMCKNLNLVEIINSGKYDDEIEDMKHCSVSEVADMIIQLDRLFNQP
jgi:hypothetical protein